VTSAISRRSFSMWISRSTGSKPSGSLIVVGWFGLMCHGGRIIRRFRKAKA
jgi:hypothetical protein